MINLNIIKKSLYFYTMKNFNKIILKLQIHYFKKFKIVTIIFSKMLIKIIVNLICVKKIILQEYLIMIKNKIRI